MARDMPAYQAALSLTTGGTSKLLGVRRRTVERYMAGRELPEPTRRLLEVALRYPAAKKWLLSLDSDPDDGSSSG
jgi:hypothetical protein